MDATGGPAVTGGSPPPVAPDGLNHLVENFSSLFATGGPCRPAGAVTGQGRYGAPYTVSMTTGRDAGA